MGAGPKHAGSEVEAAMELIVDRDRPVFFVGKRGAHSGRRTVADPIGSVPADELIMFLEIPEPRRPPALEDNFGYQRPVFILDLVPDFGRHARCGDRAGVPTPRRFLESPFLQALRRFDGPGAALVDDS